MANPPQVFNDPFAQAQNIFGSDSAKLAGNVAKQAIGQHFNDL